MFEGDLNETNKEWLFTGDVFDAGINVVFWTFILQGFFATVFSL